MAIGAGRIRQKRMLSGVRYRNKMELLKVFILIGRADVWMLSIN